jgi:hypothetical protein
MFCFFCMVILLKEIRRTHLFLLFIQREFSRQLLDRLSSHVFECKCKRPPRREMVAIFYTLTTLSLSLHLYIFSSFFPSCTYNPTGRCRVSFQFAFTWFSLPSVVVVAHILFFFLKDLHEPTPPSSRLLIITKFRRVTHAKIPPSTYHRRCAFPLTVMYTWLTLES